MHREIYYFYAIICNNKRLKATPVLSVWDWLRHHEAAHTVEDCVVKGKRKITRLQDNWFRMVLSVNRRGRYKVCTYVLIFSGRNNGRLTKK